MNSRLPALVVVTFALIAGGCSSHSNNYNSAASFVTRPITLTAGDAVGNSFYRKHAVEVAAINARNSRDAVEFANVGE